MIAFASRGGALQNNILVERVSRQHVFVINTAQKLAVPNRSAVRRDRKGLGIPRRDRVCDRGGARRCDRRSARPRRGGKAQKMAPIADCGEVARATI